MSEGLRKVSLIALWDRAAGDGSASAEMVELVHEVTGQPIIIKPAAL
jgi:hypothetical protein